MTSSESHKMSDEFNVFISWSGERSKWVADALRDWLPLVLQAAKPWMSATDIEKGSRGLNEVGNKLLGMKVGIVCLTPENLNAPWILYEAGALSKTIDDKTRLCTYLLGGLQFQDVTPPLGMFQATHADKQDTQKLVRTINRAVSADPVREDNLDRLFERMWPDLEHKLTTIPKSEQVAVAKRSPEDMVTEILEIARGEADGRKSVQAQISRLEDILSRAPFANPFVFQNLSALRNLSELAGGTTIEPVFVPKPDRPNPPESDAGANTSGVKLNRSPGAFRRPKSEKK